MGAELANGPSPSEATSFTGTDNVVVLLSHGSWEVPSERYRRIADEHFAGEGAGELSEHFTRGDGLVAKDGSDYAVGKIGEHLQDANYDATSRPPRAGRMFSNPNGPRDVATQVREATFGGVPIWDVRPSQGVQDQLVREVWDTYHERAQAGIETNLLESDSTTHTLIVDIHDTDTHVLNEHGEWVDQPLDDDGNIFPLLLVSDRNGQAAHPVVRGILGHQLLWSLARHGVIEEDRAQAEGFRENFIYKGGYTTERYGMDLPNAYLLRGDEGLKEKAQHLHFVQIELNRTMYLTPDRSGIDEEKMARTQEAVAEALAETARLIRGLELGEWRNVPEPSSKEYFSALNLPLLAASDWAAEWYGRRAQSTQFS